MARTTATIYNQAVAQYVSNAIDAGITTINPAAWSKYNYQRLIFWTMAFMQAILEQIMDAFKADVNNIKSVMPPQTAPWWQDQILNVFEYDATSVPIVQLDTTTNFVLYYPNPNPNFRIVKFCSVVPGGFSGTTQFLVAGAGPAPLGGTELAAVQSFIDIAGVPGITNTALSLDADRLFMQLDVYYQGLYSAIIQTNVITAITAYLAGIPFSGIVVLSNLESAIKAVAGVNDVVLVNIQARADTITVGTGTDLVLSNTLLQRNWQTIGGYIIPEDTSGANWLLTDFRSGSSGIKNLNLIVQ